MNRTFSFGLVGRVVIALSLVFALLILLNELTMTSVIRLSLERADSPLVNDTVARKQAFITHIRKPVILYSITAAVLSLAIASLAIHRIVIRPIRYITRALDDVAHGKTSTRVNVNGATELILLSGNFNRMIDTIQRQKTDLESQLSQLVQTTENLKATQNDLIRAARLASVGTLASGVAHEIGNPIAGILGLLDALDNETNPETAKSYRLLIRKEIQRIDNIIRDLLNYARPTVSDSDRVSDFREVLRHVTDLVRVQKNFEHIQLQLPPSDSLPQLAMAPDDLTVVMINLLLNAAQAMQGKGQIHIECETAPKPPPGAGSLIIHVKDNGPGVPSEIADQIFDPFFTNRIAGGGTGLGLAICMSVCERNSAHIELCPDSGSNDGAHFKVTVPVVNDFPYRNHNMR